MSRRLAASIALAVAALSACTAQPACWEDEVRVVVYSDPYDAVGIGTLGCVPADDLPVTGHRPDRRG